MNWPDYDRGLVRHSDIRFWIDESALEQWDAAKRRTPGGQRRFSELAISTTLMLGVVFRLPLRQTEGFVRSLVDLMGCDLPVPHHAVAAAADGGCRCGNQHEQMAYGYRAGFHGPEILWRWRVGSRQARRNAALVAQAAYLG